MTVIMRTLQAWDDRIDALIRQFLGALALETHHILTLRFTLVLIILHGATSEFAAVVVRVLGLVMLVLPSLTTHAGLWLSLSAALVASNADQWELIDNHQYLMTYWTLSCALTLSSERNLRITARLLVSVAFTFAVAWKLIAGEYLDGSFFHLTFLRDSRLQNYAGAVADSGLQAVRQTSLAISELRLYGNSGSTLELVRDPMLSRAALVMSWAGLALESLVALVYAVPSQRLYMARHASLMMFVALTYPLLPVTGFGFLLAVIGFAQVKSDDQRLKQCYFAVLCLLQITLIPWRNLLAMTG